MRKGIRKGSWMNIKEIGKYDDIKGQEEKSG